MENLKQKSPFSFLFSFFYAKIKDENEIGGKNRV